MKVVAVPTYGGPEALQLVDVPTPEAGRGQVRVRVSAATVNPADVLLRIGDIDHVMQEGAPRPFRPGMEIAGVLDQIGEDANTELVVGDRVIAMVIPIEPSGGAYAEYIVLDATQVVRAPVGTTHEQAATLPMNGLTARAALDDIAVPADATILVTGAVGAVGGYVVQLAKHAGLTVIADAAPADAQLARSLGVDVVVHRGPDLGKRVRELYPDGVAAVVDAALLQEDVAPAIAPGGVIARLRSPGERGTRPIEGFDVREKQVAGMRYRDARDVLEELVSLVEQEVLTLRVAGVVDAQDAPEAHRALEAGGLRGRMVLKF
ncbi:MAG: NADP-dependent oxidoreductase [Hyphomicrobiales bacterium]|nr:MAG: NADP-dependent oxidoreductase [Hyphomicrobiales bacterium]